MIQDRGEIENKTKCKNWAKNGEGGGKESELKRQEKPQQKVKVRQIQPRKGSQIQF